jgi:hypothetical protein
VKKVLVFLFAFSSAAAMELQDIPRLNNLGDLNHRLDDTELFDIHPTYNEYLAQLTPIGGAFVNNVTELKLRECKDLAELHFQKRDTEEAQKCMELLALAAGW